MIAHRRKGFSLLEVILAMAILAMSTGIISQIIRTASNSALTAQRQMEAFLVAEGKLAELAAAAYPLQSTGWQAEMESPSYSNVWYWRLTVDTNTVPSIFVATVDVTDATGTAADTVVASLSRWFPDPALNLDSLPAADPTTSASGGSVTASSGVAGGPS